MSCCCFSGGFIRTVQTVFSYKRKTKTAFSAGQHVSALLTYLLSDWLWQEFSFKHDSKQRLATGRGQAGLTS